MIIVNKRHPDGYYLEMVEYDRPVEYPEIKAIGQRVCKGKERDMPLSARDQADYTPAMADFHAPVFPLPA